MLNELALFSGTGGGLLASMLHGWRTVAAVEIEEYPRRVLLQRQADGILPRFPIWDDVCTFDGKPWRGKVDVISGGFPCQDISSCGRGAGIEGERSGLWSEMARIIDEVRPRYVYIENSPLLVQRGLTVVLRDLAQMGSYDVRWGIVGADDVAAPHQRKRAWVVATNQQQPGPTTDGIASDASCRCSGGVDAHTANGNVTIAPSGLTHSITNGSTVASIAVRATLPNHSWITEGRSWPTPTKDSATERSSKYKQGGTPLTMAVATATYPTPAAHEARLGYQRRDTGMKGFQKSLTTIVVDRTGGPGKVPATLSPDWVEWLMNWPIGWTDLEPMSRDDFNRWKTLTMSGEWFQVDPADDGTIPRICSGVKDRAKRLKAIGNGQVPLCAATAWSILSGENEPN